MADGVPLLNYKGIKGATYLRGKTYIGFRHSEVEGQLKMSKTKVEYSGDIIICWLRMRAFD